MTRDLMNANHFGVIVFDSTHHALAAEKAIQANEIDQIIIPTPREISASCGLAIKLNLSDIPKVIAIMQNKAIILKAAYEVCYNGTKSFTQLEY